MGESMCCEDAMHRVAQATVCDGSSKTIVIDVVAQGEKGEKGDKGDSPELTAEQMEEIKDLISNTLVSAIPDDELLRML